MSCPEHIRYIESATGYNHTGPAWIARVSYSKSKRTIYFKGIGLKSCKGSGVGANYYDFETGNEYWVSGVKKDSWNRHWAGNGKIMIERSLLEWYQNYVSFSDTSFLEVIDDLPDTDIDILSVAENQKL